MNIGSKKKLNPKELLSLLNEQMRGDSFEIGKIEIFKSFSFFEIDSAYQKKVIKAFQKAKYKGEKLKNTFEPDFICFKKIILELKSVSALNDQHRAQVHNYLRASSLKLGILVNFGHYPKVEFERIIIDNQAQEPPRLK